MARLGGFSNQQYTVNHVAQMCGGVVTKSCRRRVQDLQIDSRACTKNSLFFALPGNQKPGFAFIEDAAEHGSSAVVVQNQDAWRANALLSGYACAVIAVEDTLLALQLLAKNYKQQFSSVTTVGITGSCGKSTTKEAVAAIASMLGKTIKTPGNFNSEIGLPLSILQMQNDTQFGIFEMGIDHVGEMDRMVDMLRPDIGLLTNIGVSHLEKFTSCQITAQEKGKLFHPEMKRAFISNTCKYVSLLEKHTNQQLECYGFEDIQSFDRGLDGWDITYQGEQFHVNCVGKHLLLDVIGAIHVGKALGADKKDIAQGLADFSPMEGRSSVHRSEVTIINDSYNASLDSTTSILDYLSSLYWTGNKKIVLGPMKELGYATQQAHSLVARRLYSANLNSAFLYGEEMKGAYDLLKSLEYQNQLFYTDSFEELTEKVKKETHHGDLFLLKASRSVAMERLIPTIRDVG